PGTGPAYITYATTHSPRPVFVTGGVTPASVPPLAAAGARHFVVVRWITEADDPRRRAAELRAAIDTACDPERGS
ncbi:MAG: thiamine phosphate synthase, partial [Acidimicrobiales bacterium]